MHSHLFLSFCAMGEAPTLVHITEIRMHWSEIRRMHRNKDKRLWGVKHKISYIGDHGVGVLTLTAQM